MKHYGLQLRRLEVLQQPKRPLFKLSRGARCRADAGCCGESNLGRIGVVAARSFRALRRKIGLLLRLRLSTGLPLLINCPDMTADRAAKKPALNPRFLGERQYASLSIPTLRACKRGRGHIESHIDEEVGTHENPPFSDGCSSCAGLAAGGSQLHRLRDEYAVIQRTYLANSAS
jgi:hypothetical protein